MKKRIVLILLAAMAVFAVGCSKKAEESNKDLKEVSIVLDWYPNAVHGFIYDAIDKGYYEEEGLKVNIQFPSNTNDALSLVAAGQAEIGIYYPMDVIQARANQNVPIKSIGALTQSSLNIILSLEEKNINGPEDLEGKIIGYSGTELSEAMVRTMLRDAGVSAASVTMIDVGFDLMSSMTTGKVDATIGCMVNHEVPQMEKEGFKVSYFYPHENGVPQSYELIFVASDDMINNDKETLAAFMRASAKGFEDMKADPEAVVDLLIENQNEENFPLDKEVEMRSMEILMPVLASSEGVFGAQKAEIWQSNIDWMKAEGLLENDITPEDVMADVMN